MISIAKDLAWWIWQINANCGKWFAMIKKLQKKCIKRNICYLIRITVYYIWGKFSRFFVCQFHLEINLSFSVRPPSNIFDSEIQGKWIIWINLKCLNKIVRIKSLSMFDSNSFKLIHDICRLQLPLTSLNFKPFNGTWSRFIFNCSADLGVFRLCLYLAQFTMRVVVVSTGWSSNFRYLLYRFRWNELSIQQRILASNAKTYVSVRVEFQL